MAQPIGKFSKNQTIRNYIIQDKLGTGAYGVVFKVFNTLDSQLYVIKQIPLMWLNLENVEGIKNEAKILSQLNSQWIVKYYDSFEENNCLYIVMEYCDGGDLAKYLAIMKKSAMQLSEDSIWKIFIQISLGLAYIHSKKILHRDLKSLNIFLKKDTNVKIGDLGVAKELNTTNYAKTFVGTPYYISPEICKGRPYNQKSDVWSLGCILYEMASYNYPFNATNQAALYLKILNDPYDSISSKYSDDLQKFIDILLEKDDLKRPLMSEIILMPVFLQKAKNLGLAEKVSQCYDSVSTHVRKRSLNINMHPSVNITSMKMGIECNQINLEEKRPTQVNNIHKCLPKEFLNIFEKEDNIGIYNVKRVLCKLRNNRLFSVLDNIQIPDSHKNHQKNILLNRKFSEIAESKHIINTSQHKRASTPSAFEEKKCTEKIMQQKKRQWSLISKEIESRNFNAKSSQNKNDIHQHNEKKSIPCCDELKDILIKSIILEDNEETENQIINTLKKSKIHMEIKSNHQMELNRENLSEIAKNQTSSENIVKQGGSTEKPSQIVHNDTGRNSIIVNSENQSALRIQISWNKLVQMGVYYTIKQPLRLTFKIITGFKRLVLDFPSDMIRRASWFFILQYPKLILGIIGSLQQFEKIYK